MKIVFKLGISIVAFVLTACSSTSPSGYEKVMAAVIGANGNLYILTEKLDYEFPKSRVKDAKLFFELAPAFETVGQPISARMWVKERSVDFSFDDATLRIHKEDNYKFSRNKSMEVKEVYSQNNNAKKLLQNLEQIVKRDRSGKLALKRTNNEGDMIDYSFRTNNKVKNDKIRGKVIEIANRENVIKEYQSLSNDIKEYRINIFYEPSVIEKGIFGKKIEKETLLLGDSLTLIGWKRISPLQVK